MPTVLLSAYQCPATVTAAAASAVDCDPIGDEFDVEIISIEGSQPKITLADAQRDENVYRWEVEPSDAEIDNWGIRQSVLPSSASAYLVQGETVTFKKTALYDFRFTTSEADPQTDLTMFMFRSAAGGVIIPPTSEPPPTDDEPTANEPGTDSPGVDTASTSTTAEPDTAASSHARTPTASEESRTIERETTPMRLAADPRALLVEVLGQGAVVAVLSGPVQIGNGNWYEIESSSAAVGWVHANAFEPPPVAAEADSSTTAPPAEDTSPEQSFEAPAEAGADSVEFAPGDRTIVSDPPLQLRVAGNINADVIDSLGEGQLLRIDGEATTADAYDWYPVTLLPNGTVSGFVAAGFMEPVGLLPGDLVRIESESANVRTEPSIDAEIVVNTPLGSGGSIISGPQTSDGYDWYEVELEDGQTGWVAGELLALDSTDGTALPDTAQSSSAGGTFKPGAWVTVVDPPINLRIAAGVDAAAIDALEGGDVLIVLGGPEPVDGYDWHHVEFNGLQGYVAGEFLGGGFLPGEEARVFDGPVYLRASPSTDGDIIIGLLQDEIVTVLSPEPLIGGDYLWIEVRTADGASGFVAVEFVEAVEG